MFANHLPLARSVALLVVTLALGLASPAAAEEQIILDDLKTPPSPAFVLLGVAPTVIERPSTPRSLALSLLSATRSGDVLPRDYALDVAPYWLARHPDLTFDGYYHPGLGQTLLQNLSLSAAMSRSAGFGDSTTAIGIGVRTLLIQGRPSRRLTQLADSLRSLQARILHADTETEEDRLAAEAKTIARQIQAEDGRPVGWIVEAAAAETGLFAEDDARTGRPWRWGAWVTPAYGIGQPAIQLLVVGRWLRERDSGAGGYVDRYDLGGRLLWTANDLALSAESVRRSGKGTGTSGRRTDRTAAMVEYRLADRAYLTGTFGVDFHDGQQRRRPLLSVLGVNWGFGDAPSVGLGEFGR